MPKFQALMNELHEMGCLDADGRVAVNKKSNGKGSMAHTPVEEPEAVEEDTDDDDDEPEVLVTSEEREGFSQLLDRASRLSLQVSEKLAEFSNVLGTLKVLVESARDDAEQEEDQGEDDAEIPEPEQE